MNKGKKHISSVRKPQMKEGYKETKLGWVPENWEQYNLRDLATYRRGSFPQPYGLPEWIDEFNGFPFVQVFDVAENMRLQNATKLRISELAAKQSVFVKKGTVLITIQGSIGRVAVCQYDTYVDRTLLIIQKFLKEMDHWFFAFAMEVLFAIEKRKAPGGTIKTITKEALSSFSIPVPPFIEQQKIASILCTWIEAIQKCEQTIAALKTRNKGLAQQLLTPPDAGQGGKKRLMGFEGEWVEYQFEELLKKVKRPVDWNDDELYKLISVRRRSGGIFFRDALYGNQIKVKNLNTAKSGDFLFSKMQIVHGASAMVTEEFDDAKISGSYIAVRSKNPELLNIEYLNWYSKLPLFYHQTFTSSYGVHIEKMTFDFNLFLKEKIQLPSVEEQTAIVQVLNEAERELQLYQQKLTTLKDQKKGLMQKLLTGEVRVKIK